MTKLRQNFDKTSTRLRQNFDKTSTTHRQNFTQTQTRSKKPHSRPPQVPRPQKTAFSTATGSRTSKNRILDRYRFPDPDPKISKKIFFFKSSQDHPGRFGQPLGLFLAVSRALSVPKMTPNRRFKKTTFFFSKSDSAPLGTFGGQTN